jgi:valyl-tRNA synthetase
MPIEKNYNSTATETKLYERWEKSGAFACDVKSSKTPFTIMIPPPNVTGSLHMGHALSYTLQDILIRYRRMKGRDALWQPGTDHAGIATQMVVERQLAAQKLNRRDMGREKFLKKVWEWKAESGDMITRQLRRLGASCDWSRERFTMDEGLNAAVRKVFVTLYKEGLIYKDKRLVNWDPKMLTAVSDLEVEQTEVKGHMWHFKYPIEGSDEVVVVATTRPETMLGDTAVAIHPENKKLKHLIGKKVKLPLVGRLIPVIGDTYADPEKGTGAVKITPAHDFNDFEVGKRHKLPMINIFDQHAKVTPETFTGFIRTKGLTGEKYRNLPQTEQDKIKNEAKKIHLLDDIPENYWWLDRFVARKLIVADMEAEGLLEKIEPHTHAVPHGDRSGVPIEPQLSEQWYCNAPELAKEALKAVEEGHTKFVPEQWTNTYYAWMRNIQPWCISRQLWWGHQIPAWYGPLLLPDSSLDSEKFHQKAMFVAENEADAIAEAKKYYRERLPIKDIDIKIARDFDEMKASISDVTKNKSKTLKVYRDEDVLDTWFSSALWPFSTLGWPDEKPEIAEYYKRYYPTDVMVTGFDIIFFWVARMMMMGTHFMNKDEPLEKRVPFKTVYIHALVRDEKGHKMSKTKGNVIDPIDIIDKYGCDALRFTLANMSTPGRDIKLATSRIEGNRNFATKLWNAARFCQMNECKWQKNFDPTSVTETVNKWIVGETKAAADKIAGLLDDYRFDLSSSAAYEFVWNTFCDWYLEFTKPILTGTDETSKTETRATTAWVLGQILHLLHPFMPFITEELWSEFTGSKDMLIAAKWPVIATPNDAQSAQDEMNWVVKFISAIRTVRAELNISPSVYIELHSLWQENTYKKIQQYWIIISRLAKISNAIHLTDKYREQNQGKYAQVVFDEISIILPLSGIIDLDAERSRLKKESEKIAAEIGKLDSKLSNKDFINRAPPEVVEEIRDRKAEAEATLAKLESAQKSLST